MFLYLARRSGVGGEGRERKRRAARRRDVQIRIGGAYEVFTGEIVTGNLNVEGQEIEWLNDFPIQLHYGQQKNAHRLSLQAY